MNEQAKYMVGQIVHHRLFGYRGVIFDVDPSFQHTEEWYALMARSRPEKQQPWYHLLVDNTELITYVAEQNLEEDRDPTPIEHPDVRKYFNNTDDGVYTLRRLQN
jgi:heat shock protein HspQ